MLDILHTVHQHVKTKKRCGRAVLNISWGSFATYDGLLDLDAWGHRMLQAVKLLKAVGVTVVCAAGNLALDPKQGGGSRTTVDTVPAVFGNNRKSSDAPVIFTVGNSDRNGKRYIESQTTRPASYP